MTIPQMKNGHLVNTINFFLTKIEDAAELRAHGARSDFVRLTLKSGRTITASTRKVRHLDEVLLGRLQWMLPYVGEAWLRWGSDDHRVQSAVDRLDRLRKTWPPARGLNLRLTLLGSYRHP